MNQYTFQQTSNKQQLTMDCSICMDAITKQTGLVTLSCDHSFHFRCIDEWFTKQLLDDLNQTCPCCRSEGAQMDRCNCEIVEEEEEEYDDEDDESEDEEDESDSISHEDRLADMLMSDDWVLERNVRTGQLLFTPAIEVSLMRVRNLFGPLNDLDAGSAPVLDSAAKKIQAVYRGYKVRTTLETRKAARSLMDLFFTSTPMSMKIKIE